MQVENEAGSDGRRRIRGSEDIPRLLQELEDEEWDGPRLALLHDDAWLYGWDVLRGLIRTGRMSTVNTGRVPAPMLSETARSLLATDSSERDAVVIDTLRIAVPALSMRLQRRKFDPDRSALESYFIRGCAIAFKDVAIRWANSLPTRWYSLDDLVGGLFEAIPGDWEAEQVHRYELRRNVGLLLRDMSPLQKQIAARVGLGFTHAEIATQLGLTSARAVEGQMRRIREAAWERVNQGRLGGLFDLGILESRDADKGACEWGQATGWTAATGGCAADWRAS